MHGESLEGTYEAKILEKEMSAAGQKNDVTDDEKVELKHDAIKSVLDGGMPIFNLVRNLRNIMLYAPDQIDKAIDQLTNQKKIVNSKMLLFRFASAYEEVSNVHYTDCTSKTESDSSIKFESEKTKYSLTLEQFKKMKVKVLKTIEDAITISCENIPTLDGNCAILIDHSGSVRGSRVGESKVSPFSSVRTAVIGNLFGSMLAHHQNDVYIGMFGDKLISPSISRKNYGVLEYNAKTFDEGYNCGGATENGLYEFLKNVIKEKKENSK